MCYGNVAIVRSMVMVIFVSLVLWYCCFFADYGDGKVGIVGIMNVVIAGIMGIMVTMVL